MAGQFIWACLNPDGAKDQWIPVKAGPGGELLISMAEVAIDSGVATGGTINTLIDNTKGWQVNIWEDAMVEILDISTGISYTRELDSNLADTLNFTTNPLPAAVVAGDTYSIKRVANPLSPLARAEVHNVAVVGGANILGAAIAPLNTPALFRLTAGFDTAGILSIIIIHGGVPMTQNFNHGVVLTTNSLFMFDAVLHSGDTCNFVYSVNAQIQTFRLDEIVAAVW